ncbi:MAG TPA: hypothetical protein VHD56_15265 [Tepidisphaeraceae bacterium]|nr:hypothetical protein [Tepidisphaeraceae bacterium]
MAYQFSLENPEKAYFPWNPLATLMSDNRYYVFDYGAVDLFMAGDFISDQRLRQYTPADMQYVIYPAYWESESMHRRLSNYSRRVALPQLPGWNVYVRPEGPP